VSEYYNTYILGQMAQFIYPLHLLDLRPLPSNFRVHWRLLNIDWTWYGFRQIHFNFKMEASNDRSSNCTYLS
jgi:hypothetical protein